MANLTRQQQMDAMLGGTFDALSGWATNPSSQTAALLSGKAGTALSKPTSLAQQLSGDPLFSLGGQFPGMAEPGNLDLNARKIYHGRNRDQPNVDFRTEKSMSIGTDEGEYLIPTVVNGQQLTEEQAIQHFYETGEHLGRFATPDSADTYANMLHRRQEKVYGQ
jgi:hypothetical protein